MLIAIVMLTFVTVLVVLYLALHAFIPVTGSVDMRLKSLDSMVAGRTDVEDELAKPFKQRVLAPLTGDAAAILTKFTPRAVRAAMEQKLIMAGGFGKLTSGEFLGVMGFLALALPVIAGLLGVLAGTAGSKVIGYMLVAFLVSQLLPFLLLNQKIAKRKRSIQKDLPDVLDLLTVSVEAGLGFDGALAKLAEKMKGALVDEFNRVLQEIRMGIARRDALAAMGMRCEVPDLSLFTTSLVQADQLGVSIGNVLRVQSAAMREKRRRRAEEKAMKAPIKMLLPLILFIFPSLFVVLLGPAVIQMFASFLK
ncbi:type II secretion system F family protein [Sporomusa acidovorans]|uniref:Type II secretion system protein GspF domain-containing protein n=1 Tax=Sporomusa acidovorans (strain ATCC 49682 / DSM 3132 / Mol) TaxID=1123286 RepID=A0ABZ3IW62_SPOA4|nr:type II secretion system F family protein [Sporomusa acidovorans]OZC13988.1 bacterial type II secretion system protein F domain protein [Sporomusa acidovorans DSM 3132]SDF21852.1 tight adherence protein C [Sporomusa acidovorans]